MQYSRKSINKKEFWNSTELEKSDIKKKNGPEEVLEETDFPKKARRIQNFVKHNNNNEALVEIEEADEPSISIPPN